jgi:hypothetical protein
MANFLFNQYLVTFLLQSPSSSEVSLFTIYKSYYVSEQKTKTIDVYLLFKNEFQRKMKENKLLGMNSQILNVEV